MPDPTAMPDSWTWFAPVAFAAFCWWFGTGAVFLLERAARGRRVAATTTIAAGAGIALAGIARSSSSLLSSAPYLAFACSIVLWGALELGFLTGLLTGPVVARCPAHCHGRRHLGHAIIALLYHELALLAGAGAVAALSWSRPNPTAAWTFGLLWAMRTSAKLNLHLGVLNPGVELLPKRLEHLRVFFGRRRVNELFPVTIAAATLAEVLLLSHSLSSDATAPERVAGLLLSTLLALGILEHLALVLPVRADALWTWATRRAPTPRAASNGSGGAA
jgi:putative photosynthetic complex assembly protein 2